MPRAEIVYDGTPRAGMVFDLLRRPVLEIEDGQRLVVIDLHPGANFAHPHVWVTLWGSEISKSYVHGWPPITEQ